jgi:hypothetical protein
MSQFHDAKELISHSRAKLETIRRLHDKCVKEQTIDPLLLIDIKNFMENIRSALDYCACALFTKYGHCNRRNPKIYFPYAKLADDRIKFQGEIVERAIPGLGSQRPDIVAVLSSYQHFGNTGNWLPMFMELTNENKHQKLTPQIAKEYKMVGIRAEVPPDYVPDIMRELTTSLDVYSGGGGVAEAGGIHVAANAAGVRYPKALCGRR